MTSFRKSLLAGLLFAGIVAVGSAAPAWAAPPFPVGAPATALVGGTPLVQALCPTTSVNSGGNSTAGGVSVGSPAGAQCTSTAAFTNGEYSISGATAALPTSLRFSASCVNSTGDTGGGVDVPAGTTVPGLGVVAAQTTVTTPNTTVTYPGGTTAILNQVATTSTSVTRSAIVVTSGANSGRVIGRVTCGSGVYPLAVDAPVASAAAPALAVTSSSTSSSHSRTLLVAGAALAVLVMAQLALGRSMWRRRQAGN